MPADELSNTTELERASTLGLEQGPIRTTEAEPMAIEDIRDALVIRENGVFLLTDKSGNIPRENESGFGLYRGGTRYLSRYEFSFSQTAPIMLLSTAAPGFASEQVSTNPSMQSLDGTPLHRERIEVRRQRIVGRTLEETLRVTSYHDAPILLEVRYGFDADFAGIFEVRGFHPARRGRRQPVQYGDRSLTYGYLSLDGHQLNTRIEFSDAPVSLKDNAALFHLRLEPRQPATLALTIATLPDAAPPPAALAGRFEALEGEYQRWRGECTRIFTSNEIFNAVLEQSLNDLRMLWNTENGGYLSAGTPWFDALFGRDSVIASLQMLAFDPAIARRTLRILAAHQGRTVNEWRDEDPGKILHEMREDEMSRVGELPFGLYYGSIDSTPLFLLLAAEYWAWTADNRLIRELMPAIQAALDWVRRYGDRDGDGYIEYERHSERGLLNQGWKDSGDAILHGDGALARPPIALVEVQGYLYAARRGLAQMAAARRDPQMAAALTSEAEALKRRINHDFWLEGGYYALALDGAKQPVDSIASNAGHLLYAGVAPARRGGEVVERLLSNELFSGWGIRTLSAMSPRYNPLGYHVGTVWPHDNSIVAMGFKKYGKEAELNELATALFDAARSFDYFRLPELFSGISRSSHHAPVPYPVACKPQAWAAGTMPFLLQAILGLCPNASGDELLVVRPQLPYWLEQVQVRNLRVGRGSVDLLYEQRNRKTQVAVLNATAGLRVSVVSRWPV